MQLYMVIQNQSIIWLSKNEYGPRLVKLCIKKCNDLEKVYIFVHMYKYMYMDEDACKHCVP